MLSSLGKPPRGGASGSGGRSSNEDPWSPPSSNAWSSGSPGGELFSDAYSAVGARPLSSPTARPGEVHLAGPRLGSGGLGGSGSGSSATSEARRAVRGPRPTGTDAGLDQAPVEPGLAFVDVALGPMSQRGPSYAESSPEPSSPKSPVDEAAGGSGGGGGATARAGEEGGEDLVGGAAGAGDLNASRRAAPAASPGTFEVVSGAATMGCSQRAQCVCRLDWLSPQCGQATTWAKSHSGRTGYSPWRR